MVATDGGRDRSDIPDVSVVVAVYNTMPYLTECLQSLVRQSIGLNRLEVVAVDDGSTDDSPAELARFAAKYPSVFTVVRQENSGGPAAPSNRGLELARGRYVFFVGSDDYLGSEALERMVAAGDEYDADLIAGRMVGVGGRYVPQAIFAETNSDVDLYDSELPFAVSNTKLFRRELLDTHGIRYMEDLPHGSDQPFTVAAAVHAKRIVVLGGYDYYFAVKRENRSNITYTSTHELRLECTRRIMEANASILEPGPRRDAVLRRSFVSELGKLTRTDFLKLDRDTQERLIAGIAEVADRYLTENIRMKLDVGRRTRLSMAQRGLVDEVLATIEHNIGRAEPAYVRDDTGLYAAYPFFRDERGLPDAWFFVTDKPAEMMAYQLTVESITWRHPRIGDYVLTIKASSPFTQAELEAVTLSATIGGLRARVSFSPSSEGDGTAVVLKWSLRELTAEAPRLGGRLDVIVRTAANRVAFQTPLQLPALLKRPRRLGRVGLRSYVIRPVKQPDREFAVEFRTATREEIRNNIKRQFKESVRGLMRRARRLVKSAIPSARR